VRISGYHIIWSLSSCTGTCIASPRFFLLVLIICTFIPQSLSSFPLYHSRFHPFHSFAHTPLSHYIRPIFISLTVFLPPSFLHWKSLGSLRNNAITQTPWITSPLWTQYAIKEQCCFKRSTSPARAEYITLVYTHVNWTCPLYIWNMCVIRAIKQSC
jgi:hypothetical protein